MKCPPVAFRQEVRAAPMTSRVMSPSLTPHEANRFLIPLSVLWKQVTKSSPPSSERVVSAQLSEGGMGSLPRPPPKFMFH